VHPNSFIRAITYISLLRIVNKQKDFLQKTLVQELAPFKEEPDGSLDDSDFSKIINYYAFGVPSILGTAFGTLRGTLVKEDERKVLTYLGALTGFSTIFLIRMIPRMLKFLNLINNPAAIKAKNDKEKLFLHFTIMHW
jgi:hypothetical protein